MSTLVLGADGGGTKTHGIISDAGGNELARHTSGPSNPNVVGFEVAARNLFDLIVACCTAAGRNMQDLQHILLGLAGAGREENRLELRSRICALAHHDLPVTIETDARIGLEGAFEGGAGVVIIAGTGSVVIGKNASGETLMIGGWGRAFGDEGSGYFLGMEAVKSLRLYLDGRGGSNILAGFLAGTFGLNSRESLITAVYHEKFEFSKAAPLVLDAAAQHDALALSILNAGANELSDQARTLVARLNISGTVGIVFSGGLIAGGNVYSTILKAKIAEMIPSAEVRLPARSPAEGAVLMALRKLQAAE